MGDAVRMLLLQGVGKGGRWMEGTNEAPGWREANAGVYSGPKQHGKTCPKRGVALRPAGQEVSLEEGRAAPPPCEPVGAGL